MIQAHTYWYLLYICLEWDHVPFSLTNTLLLSNLGSKFSQGFICSTTPSILSDLYFFDIHNIYWWFFPNDTDSLMINKNFPLWFSSITVPFCWYLWLLKSNSLKKNHVLMRDLSLSCSENSLFIHACNYIIFVSFVSLN